MRIVKVGVTWLLMLGLSTAAFAGDLRDSVANATFEQAPQPPGKIPSGYLWAGAGLFVAGMSTAVYGFLHTKGGDFVSGEVSKESNTTVGGAGLAIAGLGGAILFLGSQRTKHAPSITFGAGGITVAKRISW
jgi:amino acid transporter